LEDTRRAFGDARDEADQLRHDLRVLRTSNQRNLGAFDPRVAMRHQLPNLDVLRRLLARLEARRDGRWDPNTFTITAPAGELTTT
jgi:hypothetical protein